MTDTLWCEIPYDIQQDLVDWYNQRGLLTYSDTDLDDTGEGFVDEDDEIRNKLAKLYGEGKFHSWHCPSCHEKVYNGQPDNWDDFQSVLEQDFASYPGQPDELNADIVSKQCDECRL